MALLHLAVQSELLETDQLRVFTVDHGLRAEAREEARMVAEVSQQLGVAHQILKWSEPNASQARARDARHRLLAAAVTEAGGKLLLTGHTLSDNVESFLIRARAGSGWYGLAGMSALSVSPVWPEGEGVFILRPMLTMQRGAVRSWLSAKGATWCDDPSNENPHYERVRMRGLLEGAPQRSAQIARIQSRLRPLRAARDGQIADMLACADVSGNQLSLPLPAAVSAECLAQTLQFAAMAVTGSQRPARSARALSAATRLLGDPALTLTLGGAVVRKSKDTLIFRPESNRPQPEFAADPCLRLQHICTGLLGSAPA